MSDEPIEIKALLRTIDPGVPAQIGREAFPVGEWTHAAADYIEQLEIALARAQRVIASSYYPIQMRKR